MTNTLNLSEQQLSIFKEIIVNDLKEYAKLLSQRHSLNYDEIVSLIPEVLDKPVHTKISSSFHDISNIKYKFINISNSLWPMPDVVYVFSNIVNNIDIQTTN